MGGSLRALCGMVSRIIDLYIFQEMCGVFVN